MSGELLHVRVAFRDAYTGQQFDGTIAGAASAAFVALLNETLPTSSPGSSYFIPISTPSGDGELLLLDRNASIASVSTLFGSDVVQVDNGGRGGGGFWITVSQVAEAAPVIGKALTTTRNVVAIALGVRYGEQRTEVKDWDDSGVVSSRLAQMVLAENPWRRDLFDRTFGLTRERGGELLRSQGYYRWGVDESGTELWAHREPS